MAFDGIVLNKVVCELNSCLIGGKINKVYEPNKNEIILGIYSNGKNFALLCNISSNSYRMHLTTNSKTNPLNAPNFCMLLRKHLIGSKIKSISTPSLERVVTIELETFNELNDLIIKKLVIELMGKHSNIILLNENNKIIDSLRHLDISSGSLRDILPARDYILPTSNKKDFLSTSKQNFTNLICNEDTISSYVSNLYIGISSFFMKNLIHFNNINDTDFSKNNLSKVYELISNILNNLNVSLTSCIFINNDYTILFNKNNEFTDYQTNYFLDDFYFKKEIELNISNYRNNLLKLILATLKKESKKISNINSKLKDCKNIDLYRTYGELITSNLYQIDVNKNQSSITLLNYYDENKPITIPLDSSISIAYNAKNFFKKYHKLKSTKEIVSIQKLQAEKDLDYLESIIYELENSTSIEELDEIYLEICENGIFKVSEKSNIKKNKINKKKVHNEYEPITYTVDNFTLYVGKNNKQNDYITTKLGKNEDYWFHTKDIRGSHCLLKCNGKHVEKHTLISCAQIAAFHSKARLSSNVPVDYCFVKYVKKPSSSKPGMVTYTNNKTLYVNPKN